MKDTSSRHASGRDPGSSLDKNLGPGQRHAGATVFYFSLAVMVVLHISLGLKTINALSATYDEPVHLTAGAAALKTGNHQFNGLHHPIFGEAWAALPVLFLNPQLPVQNTAWLAQRWSPVDQYRFADLFLYHNRVDHEKLLNSARRMQLLLSVLFMVAAALLILTAFGPVAAFWFAGSWAFSPTILAHATLVSTDLAFAGFFFLFFLVYSIEIRWKNVLLGVLLGLCFASKYLAVAALPVAAFLWAYDKKSLRGGLIVLACAVGVLLLVYRSHLGIFFDGLSRIVTRTQAGRSSFFWGRYSTDGWLLYFPFAFAAKSTLFELAGLVLAKFMMLRKKLTVPKALWLAPLAFFVVACFSKVQIGHRHILAVYPFVFLLGGLALQKLGRRFEAFAPIAVGLMCLEGFFLAPNFLPYFNVAAGGPGQGHRYLTDSNNDWGQGLKQLAAALTPEDRKDGIYLCYFGTADPHAYGLRYIDIGSDAIAGHSGDEGDLSVHPTKFAISVTNLQGTYYADKTVFAWLKDTRPWKNVGNSIFVYDFSNEPDFLVKLNELRGGQ